MLSPWEKTVISTIARTRRERVWLVRFARGVNRRLAAGDGVVFGRAPSWRLAVGQVLIGKVDERPELVPMAGLSMALYVAVMAYVLIWR